MKQDSHSASTHQPSQDAQEKPTCNHDEHGHDQAAHSTHEVKTQNPSGKPAASALHTEIEGLRRELDQSQEQIKKLQDQYLRTLAEVDNTKKRLDREKLSAIRFAAETLIRGLLPIMDSLDQAMIAAEKQPDLRTMKEGLHLIHKQLLGLLEKEGVKRIPTVGMPFDPHRHEAIAQVEAKDTQAAESIVEELQVGYTMHDKVIRPAMVKVAKKSAISRQQSADSTQQTERP